MLLYRNDEIVFLFLSPIKHDACFGQCNSVWLQSQQIVNFKNDKTLAKIGRNNPESGSRLETNCNRNSLGHACNTERSFGAE